MARSDTARRPVPTPAPVYDDVPAAPRRETFRQRLRRRMRPPRRLRFTRMGKWYLAFTLVLGFAAINTGNNLLFLILGLLLAGIVISGVLSESTLRAVSVERLLPLDPTAAQPSLVGIRLTNHKRRAPSFAVLARDITESGEAGRVFLLKLGAGESRELAYSWEPRRRGRVVFVQVELSTRFPFGLFEKLRDFDLPGESVVFPREVSPALQLARRSSQLGERPSNQAGPGTEYFGLREARPGDDARLIHWRTSARRGRPVVVERERERRRRVVLRLDNRRSSPTALPGKDPLDAAVEQAAALARRARLEGSEVAFVASGITIPPGAGAGHERRVLRALALLGPAVGGPAPKRVAWGETVDVPVYSAPAEPPREDVPGGRRPGGRAA